MTHHSRGFVKSHITHCPFCGFDTNQYAADVDPDGLPTGWVCLVDTKHRLDH